MHGGSSGVNVKLIDILPWFYQHVSIVTRGNNTLNSVYTNRPRADRAVSCPHLGFSDHISILLVPAHCPVLKDQQAHTEDNHCVA